MPGTITSSRPAIASPSAATAAGGLEYLSQRPVAELEHVAEQDEAVDPLERGEKRLGTGPAQQVGAAAEAEVQVGDHRGAHAAIVPTVADGTITRAMAPDPQDPGRRPQPSRLLGIGARGAERMAAATGIDDAVERTTEEAIVRALESPAVERAIIRVLESEAAQDALSEPCPAPRWSGPLSRCSTPSWSTTSGTDCCDRTRRRS